jgi:hypothetical protein
MEFRGSETLALQWANQFQGDIFALCALRRLVGGTFPPLSDEEVAEEVAWRLASGVWVARRRRLQRMAVGGTESVAEAAAFPKEDRRPAAAPPRTPAPDAPLFPDDIDPAAIAEAQKRAAALGVPFCEECLRAQMAMAAG